LDLRENLPQKQSEYFSQKLENVNKKLYQICTIKIASVLFNCWEENETGIFKSTFAFISPISTELPLPLVVLREHQSWLNSRYQILIY